MTTPQIMSVFQFTPHDLAISRTGYATPQQAHQKTQASVIDILLIVLFSLWTVNGAFFSIVVLFVFVLLVGIVLLGSADITEVPYELAGYCFSLC